MHANQVQLRHLGDLAGLPSALQLKLTKAMEQTRNNTGLVVNLAINYGGRAEIRGGKGVGPRGRKWRSARR